MKVGHDFAPPSSASESSTKPDSMKAFIIDRHGKHVRGRIGIIAGEPCGPREVRIAVRAASVNPLDYKVRDGAFRPIRRYPLPLILGHDGAGVVITCGAQVRRFHCGDEVYFCLPVGRRGSWAESVIVDESAVAMKPANLSFEEAAALPLAGLTAMQVLQALQIGPGSRLLILGGSGGVGSLAIQFAKALGVFVTVTAGKRSQQWVRELGADQSIDYSDDEAGNARSHLTDGRGYDAAFDTVGGPWLARALGMIRGGSTLLSIAGPPTSAALRSMDAPSWIGPLGWAMSLPSMLRARRLGVHYRFHFMKPDGLLLDTLRGWAEAGRFRPLVDRVFAFGDMQKAIEHVESGRTRGKVVVSLTA